MSITSDVIDAESVLSDGELFDEETIDTDGRLVSDPVNDSNTSKELLDLNNTNSSIRNQQRSSSRQKSFNSSINRSNISRAGTPTIHSFPSRFSVESPIISFSKGERKYTYVGPKNDTPGPIYEQNLPKTTSSSFSFPKGKRFVEEELKILQQAQKPPPTAYNPKAHIKYRTDPSYSFGSKTPVQELRSASPGPIYYPAVEEAMGRHSRSPTTFGAGDRSLKISNGRSDSPPPGAYNPNLMDTKRNISFGISKKEENYIYFGDRLSANKESMRVPGPIYDPSYRYSINSSPSYSFGRRTPLPSDQVYSENPGLTDYEKQFLTPSFSIQGKDKEVDPNITPHAPRARFLGDQFLSENFGRASPGPKYDVSQSFIIPSKRVQEEDHIVTFKAKEKKKKNTPNPVYLGYSIAKSSGLQTEGPGYVYEPKSDFSSQVPRVTGPVMKPSKPVDKRKLPEVYPQLRHPSLGASSKIKTSTVPKFVKNSNTGIRQPPPISHSPGPIYKVDFDSLEKIVKRGAKGGKFGGLS